MFLEVFKKPSNYEDLHIEITKNVETGYNVNKINESGSVVSNN